MILIDNRTEYKNVLIEELKLSLRSGNALHRADIHTLYQLIESYNKGDLLEFRNLGRNSFEEIEQKLLDAVKNDPGMKDVETKEEFEISEEIKEKSVFEFGGSHRLTNCLLRKGYKTVGEVLELTASDILDLRGAGVGTVDEFLGIIKEIREKGEEYFYTLQPEDEPIDESGSRRVDIETVAKLRDEFDFKTSLLMEWYGISRQRVYQILDKRINRGNWVNREFGEFERSQLEKMIDKRLWSIEDDNGGKVYFLNNRKDDCAVIFVNDTEIKCFFMNMLPDDLRVRISGFRMDCLSPDEIDISDLGERVYILRQEYFRPKNSNSFRQLANIRGMTVDEYSMFLTGLPVASGQSTIDDDKILEFLHAHYVDGRLMIPSNNSTHWFRSFISRNGYTIDEIAKLYDLGRSSNESELSITDTRVIEEDMQDYGEADSWINSLYAQNPLIGNKRISDNTKEKLYKVTKKYIDQILKNSSLQVPLTVKMQITLMVITFAKEWDVSDESGFWKYITTQFGYRDDNGRLRGILCDYVLDAMHNNHRWFMTSATGHQYKSTIVIHALTTKRSWMRLFDFLFDFYKNNMDWTYIEDDPIIYRMVEALRNKLIAGDEVNEDNLEISNTVYTFHEGIRKLVIYRTGYAAKLISHMLHRIDDLINHNEKIPKLYVDELCDIWIEERLRGASESRTREKTEKKRNVAVDYSRIRPVYLLEDETKVLLSFPDIRLKQIEFKSARVIVFSGEKEIESRTLDFYGNELGKTLSGFDIDIDRCLRSGDGVFNLRTILKCDDEIIYDSGDSLYRDLLCFSSEREVSVSSCRKGSYSFFAPSNACVDFLDAEVSEIDAGNCFKAFFVRLGEDFVVKTEDTIVAYDEDNDKANSGIKIVLPKICENAAYIHNGKKYEILSEIGNITVIVQKGYDPRKSRILMNTKSIDLMNYESEEMGNSCLYKIPLQLDQDGICETEVIDLDNNRISAKASFKHVPGLTCTFDKNAYFSNSDYEDAYVRLSDGKKIYTERFGANQETVSITTESGEYDIKIPRIIVRTEGGDLWEMGKCFWIRNFEQNDKIYISSPDNCQISLMLNGIGITEDTKNTYSIGNAVFAYSSHDTNEWIVIEMDASIDNVTQKYVLGKISANERFVETPKFDYVDGKLYWNRGIEFIGNKEAEIKLVICAEGNSYSYPLELDSKYVMDIVDIPLGPYSYKIVKKSENIFALSEDEIVTGSLLIGDKNALRFKDSMICITHITNEDDGQLNSVEIKGTYIDNLEYQGIQYVDSEERECPVYTGTMFYIGASGKHHYFSREDSDIADGHSIYKVNPVNVVYINEHTISITNEEGDGIYYYRDYNRAKMSNSYLVTDKNPNPGNQKNYYLADLYLYKKEKTENV